MCTTCCAVFWPNYFNDWFIPPRPSHPILSSLCQDSSCASVLRVSKNPWNTPLKGGRLSIISPWNTQKNRRWSHPVTATNGCTTHLAIEHKAKTDVSSSLKHPVPAPTVTFSAPLRGWSVTGSNEPPLKPPEKSEHGPPALDVRISNYQAQEVQFVSLKKCRCWFNQQQTYLLPPTPPKKKHQKVFICFTETTNKQKRCLRSLTQEFLFKPNKNREISLVFLRSLKPQVFRKNQATWYASCKLEFQVHHVHPTHESHGDPPSALKFKHHPSTNMPVITNFWRIFVG